MTYTPHGVDDNEFVCLDCKVNTLYTEEYYMVNDYLWKSAFPTEDTDGMLCVGCLEARIGRTLTPSDFTPAPLNQENFNLWGRSDRLNNRLGYL